MAIEDETARRNRSKSSWKQKTKMERRLIIILIIATLIIIGLIIAIAVVSASRGKTSACLTKTCIQEADHLFSVMNTDINPCDNFYEFACGRFVAETEIPEDKTELDPLSSTAEEVSKQVRTLLDEASKPGEIRPIALVKNFYKLCTNTTAIEENGADQLKDIFNKLGGWPILEENNWIESNWIEITHRLRQNGLPTNFFISIDPDINVKNSSEYIISVDQPVTEDIGESNLKEGLNDDLVKSFADNLIDLAVLFGADKNFATKEVHAVIDFRAKIAQFSVPKAEHTDMVINANETTIGALQRSYPFIPWIDYITGSLAIPNRTLTEQTKILLIAPKFLTEFQTLISRTPKRVQANYVMLLLLRTFIDFLPEKIREKDRQFIASATGASKATPRWSSCILKATNYFHLAADALYVSRYVDDQEKTDVADMVSRIQGAFVKILKDVEWMDSVTKQLAIEKAEYIKPYIAYPEELKDNKKLEEYYAQIKTDSSSPIELICQASKAKRDNLVALYGLPVTKSHWTLRFAAITSNAVYDPQSNSIQIPSGIMQNVFFNKDRPQYMNYAGLGMVIGHEITHGFDNVGKVFDKNGNTATWWKPATLQAYASKAECFVEQYGKYTAPEVNLTINGKNTLGENIADNGGIKEAYLAYLDWVKQNKEELPLPAVKYTPKQLFWISVATAWCSKSRPAAIEQAILGDEHSPNRFRILGGLSNIDHFAHDFNCPVGSKMNPAKKCQLW